LLFFNHRVIVKNLKTEEKDKMKVENLRSFLANINMTAKDFCELINYNPTYLSKVLKGRVVAGERLKQDVLRATNGVVCLPTNPKKRSKKKEKES
jgi:predicted transcriptional regulator